MGRPAEFHNGGEFPILVEQSQAKQSIEYRKFGTSIKFLPTKLSGEKLRLEIRVEHAERDNSRSVTSNGSTVPGLRTRRLDTALDLVAGQTAILQGDPDRRMLVMITPEIVDPLAASVPRESARLQRLPAVREIPQSGPTDVSLLAGNSMVLAFPHKIPKLTVGKKEIVKAQPTAPDKVQITAEQAGTTTLTVWDEESRTQKISINVSARELTAPSVPAAPPEEKVQPTPAPPQGNLDMLLGESEIISALDAEHRLHHLRGILGDKHPSVLRLKQQIELLERQREEDRAREEHRQQEAKDRAHEDFSRVVQEMFPDAKLKVRSLGSGVILSGTVTESGRSSCADGHR